MTDYNKLLNDLNEIYRKVQGLRPLNVLQVKELRGYYKIGLTWSSNALEGNSLTETETKIAIEDGLTAGGKPLHDYYEAIGHAESYDFLYDIVDSGLMDKNDAEKWLKSSEDIVLPKLKAMNKKIAFTVVQK